MAPPIVPVETAIYARLVIPTDPDACWDWTGQKDKDGYCTLSRRPKPIRIHRWMLEHHIGQPIPVGMQVCHHCDNTSCTNPKHLFIGTCRDNKHDAMSKGRNTRGEITGNSKLTADMVRQLRAANKRGSLYELRIKFGIHKAHASKIRKGLAWKHV